MERNYRPLILSVVFGALILGVGWSLGVVGERDPVYVPRFFDRIQLGMTTADAQAMGAILMDTNNPGGPTGLEFRPSQKDPDWELMQLATGMDPIETKARFEGDHLVYFETKYDRAIGTRVGLTEIIEMTPDLFNAKMLRRTTYSVAELVDALGEGVVIGRILDQEHGRIDIYRWSLDEERPSTHLDVHIANGEVLGHHLQK